jgi:putative ABC transport system permease protein
MIGVAIVAAAGALLAGSPIARRLAFRNVARRRREALLVVLGSAFGTAMLTGALVVGDSFGASLRGVADRRLGPVDDVVATPDTAVAARVLGRLASTRPPHVRGAVLLRTGEVVASAPNGRIEPRAGVIALDLEAARRFGGDAEATGLAGLRLRAGEVAVTEDLASRLRVGAGETLRADAGRDVVRLRIARVVPSRGLAGFSTGVRAHAPNIVGRLETLAWAANGAAIVAVSYGPDATAETAAAGRAELRRALAGIDVAVEPVRRQLLDEARRESAALGQLFVAGAVFGIAAGLMLLGGLFVMLADDRANELGVMRALGMRRRTLVRCLVAEGACYAIPAAVLGAVVGIGLGWALLQLMNTWFESGWMGRSLSVHVHVTAQAVHAGLVFGLVGALGAVGATAWSIARRNLVASMRGTHVRAPRGRHPAWVARLARVVAAAAFAAGVAGLVTANAPAVMLAPAVALVACAPSLRARMSPRAAFTGAGTAAIVWALLAVVVARARGIVVSPPVLATQGLVVTALAVALVSAYQPELGRGISRLRRGAVAPRVALAYPQVQRLRTGTHVGMFALVTFTVMFAVIDGSQVTANVRDRARDSGGEFTVLGTASPARRLPADRLRRIVGVDALAPLATTTAQLRNAAGGDVARRPLTVFDQSLLQRDPPALTRRGRYRTDAEAYRAVLGDPDLVIVSGSLLQPFVPRPTRRLEPGDRLQVRNPVTGAWRTLTVAATTGLDYLSLGVLTSAPAAARAFGAVPPVTGFLVATPEGLAEEVAAVIHGDFWEEGIGARTVRDVVAGVARDFSLYMRAVQATQALGLVAGVCGLAVVMARAVRERRRELAVLRAIGARGAVARRTILVETVFVAAQGLAIGAVLATITSYLGHPSIQPDVPWAFPARAITGIGVLVVVVAAASALAPARAAARVRPAAALRVAD